MPDGTVNHEVASHTTAVMMLENAKDKDAAWEFMKWWTAKETQIAYGREMEGLMGEAARYPTANIEALEAIALAGEGLSKSREPVAMGARNSAGSGRLFHRATSGQCVPKSSQRQ